MDSVYSCLHIPSLDYSLGNLNNFNFIPLLLHHQAKCTKQDLTFVIIIQLNLNATRTGSSSSRGLNRKRSFVRTLGHLGVVDEPYNLQLQT